jgi:hypothetical protein
MNSGLTAQRALRIRIRKISNRDGGAGKLTNELSSKDDGGETMPKTLFTTVEVGAMHGLPDWRIRRLVDELFPDKLQRVGQWRLIPISLLGAIEKELRKRGHIQAEAEAVAK